MSNTKRITVGYISDLHLDFYCKEYNPQHRNYKKQIKEFVMSILPDSPELTDVLIIAGDTGHRNDQTKVLLLELKKIFANIAVVSGNHDLYLINDRIGEQFNWDSFKREQDIIDFCHTNGIAFLNGTSVEVKGFTISGLGMFWDTSYLKNFSDKMYSKHAIRELYSCMNDIRYISNGSKPQVIRTAYGGGYLHNTFDELEYSQQQKDKLNQISKADIMVSHYIPVPYKTMPQYYKKDITTVFYTFDGEKVLGKLDPYVWIFGHTHVGVREQYKNTMLLCNPKGYPSENRDSKIKVVTIEK
jgi:predicted phosphodiesterase